MTSQFGVPCVECGGQGWLDGETCRCNLPSLDPNADCAIAFPSNRTEELERVNTLGQCICHQSRLVGWYNSSDPLRQYGKKNPPYCNICPNPGVGPEPGVLVDDPELTEIYSCRSFGGPDPAAKNDSSFRTCSNHGVFDYTRMRCDCNAQWELLATGYQNTDVPEYDIVTCATCAPFYGPREGVSMCSTLITPDPLSGRDAPCGGHGAFTSFGCDCYSNITAGFWQLSPVVDNFTIPVYTTDTNAAYEYQTRLFNVSSCVKCQEGYTLSSQCTELEI